MRAAVALLLVETSRGACACRRSRATVACVNLLNFAAPASVAPSHCRADMMRVLLVDDGEVVVDGLVRRLRALGAHVVVLRDFFEVPSLLDSQAFDVLLGHELLLVLALELKAPGQRWLLTSMPESWTQSQLVALHVHAVITEGTDEAELNALLGHRAPR